jgi:ElaB/YqjD/DUF883 family membrane-anchored ribosome-binding protein
MTAENLAADIRLVISEVEELLQATAGQQDKTLAAVRVKVLESLDSAKSELGLSDEEAAGRARTGACILCNYVRKHPLQALGITALAGIAIGLLIGRR